MSEKSAPEALGRYQIVRELGKGAMGVVYEGLDPNIGRKVAIKTARRDVMEASGMADEMMERFLREAQAAGALNHPNIITVYDADEQDGIAYIAMEFLDGGDLQDLLAKKARLDPADVVSLAGQICDALDEAHEHGIVHRDIKPANIMMLPEGVVKVTDFGIARVSDSNLTQEGTMIGTPHYMSPEQFMGQKVDGRSDLFSVGIIIYEMLTGEKPFPGEALSAVMHSVVKVTPVEPKEYNYAVNDCLSRVVMKALSKAPGDRYQTGKALTAALEESLKPNPDPAITGLGARAAANDLAATKVAGSQDATVVASNAPNETLALGSADSTVAAKTPPGGVEPSTVQAAPAADTTPAAEAGTTVLPAAEVKAKAKPPMALIAGIAVAVILVVAGGIYFMQGGASNGEVPNPTPAPTPTATPTPTGNAFSKAAITVWLAETKEAYSAALDGEYEDCDPNGEGTIVVTEKDSGEELGRAESVSAKTIDLSRPAAKVKLTVSSEGYKTEEFEEHATESGQTLSKDVVLLRDADSPS